MLTKWKLFNFKAIQQETELDFKPLTIFAGANSSGKSTVLQSMLLISQTLSSEVTNRPVVLNGDLVRLGQFDDLKSNGSEANQITIGWELHVGFAEAMINRAKAQDLQPRVYSDLEDIFRDTLRRVSADLSFDAISDHGGQQILQLQPALASLEIRATLRSAEGSDETSSVAISRRLEADLPRSDELTHFVAAARANSEALRYVVEFDEQTEHSREREGLPHEIRGCLLQHFLPSHLLTSFRAADMRAEAIIRALAGKLDYRAMRTGFAEIIDEPMPKAILDLVNEHFAAVPHPVISKLVKAEGEGTGEVPLREISRRTRILRPEERERIRTTLEGMRPHIYAFVSQGDVEELRWRLLSLPPPFQIAVRYTSEWFSTCVKYLGPLRDEPKPLYPLVANVDPKDVGLRGEHTAAVFHLHLDRIIEYIPSENFREPAVTKTPARRSLRFAVSDWLRYLGVAAVVETEDKGKLGHELWVRLDESDMRHDLTHVGVGVSQVLPIVVSCLLAEPNTLLIFEQPELHLHPRVQTLLADFFLSIALLGKQCVLETHSEYLINRLRFRAAAAEGKQLVDTLQIYFVEKSGVNANFRKIDINEYGAILDWPEGFFDQSQAEAEGILREATLKRKRQSRNARNA